MLLYARIKISKSLKCCDEVVKVIDKDDFVTEIIKFYRPYIFAKGGYSDISNLLFNEFHACKEVGAKIFTGLGRKMELSSYLVEREKFFKDKNKKFDLHIHSNCSDGGLDVKSIVEKACQEGVKLISITDHNNIDAYNQLKKIVCKNILIINGVECDVEFKGRIFHILMYGFDLDNIDVIKFFKVIRNDDLKIFEKMIEEVCFKFNLKITKKEVEKFEKENVYFDKVRLNNFLASLNLASSPKEAFYKFTKDIVDKKRKITSAKEFFMLAKKCNAITILAHPMKYVDDDFDLNNLKELILELKKIGLDGIEVFNNRQTIEAQEELYNFAINHNMEYSAGSDMHSKIGSQEKKEIGKALGQNITLKMFSPALIKVFESKFKN